MIRIVKREAKVYRKNQENGILVVWLRILCDKLATPADFVNSLTGMLNNVPRDRGIVIEGNAPDWGVMMVTNHFGRGFLWKGRYDYDMDGIVVIETREGNSIKLGEVWKNWTSA